MTPSKAKEFKTYVLEVPYDCVKVDLLLDMQLVMPQILPPLWAIIRGAEFEAKNMDTFNEVFEKYKVKVVEILPPEPKKAA